MAELTQKSKKHTSINGSIKRLNMSRNGLQNLVSEISGGGQSPAGAEAVEKEPEVSLKETLETTPERLNELSDSFNKIRDELRELLF